MADNTINVDVGQQSISVDIVEESFAIDFGDVGISGISGFSGYSSYSGYSGVSGYSAVGIDGTSGYSGTSGFSGESAWSGVSGFSGIGTSGFSGIAASGYSGISGWSGTSGMSGAFAGSGTSGYVPTFTGYNSLSKSSIYDAGSGYVGIGLENPTYRFQVLGTGGYYNLGYNDSLLEIWNSASANNAGIRLTRGLPGSGGGIKQTISESGGVYKYKLGDKDGANFFSYVTQGTGVGTMYLPTALGIGIDAPTAQLHLVKADSSGLTDFLINPTIKSSGNLIDAQVGGVSKFSVNNNGTITFANASYLLGTQLNAYAGFYFRQGQDLAAGNQFTFDSGANRELTDTDAEQSFLYIEPKINQSGTASYNALKISAIETATGSGTKNLIDAGTNNGAGVHTSKFSVSNTGVTTTKDIIIGDAGSIYCLSTGYGAVLNFGTDVLRFYKKAVARSDSGTYGAILIQQATDALPAFSFAGDTNTGIGTAGADQLSLIAGGVEGIRLVENTDVKVGIQTSAPDKQLEINSATGDCLRLTYNDSNGSATTKTDLTLDSAGEMTILSPTDKTFVISPVVWEDLRVPVTSTKAGGSKDPGFAVFKTNGSGSQGVFCYWFDKDAEEELYFTTQLPHSWAGTAITPHIHWVPKTAATGKTVEWGLEYTWVNINGTFGDTSIIYTKTTTAGDADYVAGKHYMSNFSAITPSEGSQDGISSMLLCRVFRNATDATDDTYEDDAGLLEIDFHFAKNTVGSRTISTK